MYVCVYMVGIQVCISSECVYGTTIERERERESGKSVCWCVDECITMAKGIIRESGLMHKPNSMDGME